MKALKPLIAAILCGSLAYCAAAKKPKAPGEDPNSPKYYFDRANVALRYSLTDQAIEYLDQALDKDPDHIPSLNLLGAVHYQLKDYGKAAAALERCLSLKPDFVEAINRLGQAYEGLGRTADAEAVYQKSLAVDGNGFASFSLGKIRLADKNYPEALRFVDQSIEKAPKEAAAYNLKGVILNQMGRYPEAVAILRTALALAPKDPSVRINLGIGLMNAAEYDQARDAFEKALPLITDPALRSRVEDYLNRLAGMKK